MPCCLSISQANFCLDITYIWLVIMWNILPTLCENKTNFDSRNHSFVVFELEKLVWWWMHNSAHNEGITCTFITCQAPHSLKRREMCVKINEILFCELKLLTSKWVQTRPMLYTSLMISDVQLTQFYMSYMTIIFIPSGLCHATHVLWPWPCYIFAIYAHYHTLTQWFVFDWPKPWS